MKIFLTITLLFLLNFFGYAQEMQGIVTSSEDGFPIEGAHIVNTSAAKMAISTDNGRFTLTAKRGDTLIVSNVNFNTKQFIIKNAEVLNVVLNPASIQLEEVRVSNMPENEADFKRIIVDMGVVKDDTFVPFGMAPAKPRGPVPKNFDPNYNNSVGYAINKPISFIVKKFSKSHKSKVKYYQTVASQGKVIANEKKYNHAIVEELTGLQGDELIAFIQYIDLDAAFIQRSSEYEIAARILEEFGAYQSRKG